MKQLFEELTISRIVVWTIEGQVSTFCPEDTNYEIVSLPDRIYDELEVKCLEFLKSHQVCGKTIFDFGGSRGVLYINDGALAYCGDIMDEEGKSQPFSPQWLS